MSAVASRGVDPAGGASTVAAGAVGKGAGQDTPPTPAFTFSPTALAAAATLAQPAQAHHQHSASAPSSLASAAASANAGAPAPAPAPSRSFFSFLRGELLLDEPASPSSSATPGDAPSQLVYNFLVLPWFLERLFTLGCLICADCFLHLFTVLPMRCVCAIASVVGHILSAVCGCMRRGNSAIQRKPWARMLSPRQWCDLTRGLLLATCWAGLAWINMSYMYHYIRGQSVLKLYVIFNMLQISDKLFCSFGEDILESLFGSIVTLATPNGAANAAGKGSKQSKPAAPSSTTVQVLHVLFHFGISVIYVFCHSVLLFAQVITLNVSVNSDNSSLFVVLVSNNFIELKGSVFKRFDHHNLMQIAAADIVERFQLTVFLGIILVQNLAHLGLALARSGDWLPRAGGMCFMVLGGEWVVDWIKHGFITKFNGIPPVVYRHFGKVLCTDFIYTHRHKTESSIHSVSRRLGLPSLPIAVLVVRVVYQAFVHSPTHLWLKGSLLLIGMLALVLLKCLLTIGLLGHAAKRVLIEPLEREKAEAFASALAAGAHQHLRPSVNKHSPSPRAIVPRSPPQQVNITPLLSGVPPPHPSQAQALAMGNLMIPSAMGAAVSSTSTSPSLFGLREPRVTAAASASMSPAMAPVCGVMSLPPLALEPPSSNHSEVVSRPESPAFVPVSAPARVLSSSLPSATAALDDEESLMSSESQDTVSEASLASATLRHDPRQSPLARPQARHPPLLVSVQDAPVGSAVALAQEESDSLTRRFGHLIRTPTALERCNSSMSPQPPVTPLSANLEAPAAPTQTLTLQLEGGVHYASSDPAMATSPLRHTNAPGCAGCAEVDDASRSSSSVVRVTDLLSPHRGTLQSQQPPHAHPTVQLPSDALIPAHSSTCAAAGVGAGTSVESAADGSEVCTVHGTPGSSSSASVSTGIGGTGHLDVHIYHHNVPAPGPMGAPVSVQLLASPQKQAGEEGGAAGAAPAAAPAVVSAVPLAYPPTVLTINASSTSSSGAASGGSKEKGQPAYEDAAKIESDLLGVHRYKIAAGKAIPV